MKRAGALVACGLVVSACFADLLVGPEPNVAPSFSIVISSLDDVERSYNVGAFLRRGSDGTGEPRDMLDATLLVGDSVVLPDSTRDGFGLRYTWAMSSVAALDSIRIRTPVVADLPASGMTFALPIPVRNDALLGDHVLGQDFAVALARVGDTIPGLVPISLAAGWQFDIRTPRTSGSLFRLDGRGMYPSPIRIPAEFLPLEAGDSLAVSLHVFAIHRAVGSAYPVTVTTSAQFMWHRRVVPP